MIPQDWWDGYVHPIPKPTEWRYELKNTRPITLLDSKSKNLNTKLTQVNGKHSILKGAATPGSSLSESFMRSLKTHVMIGPCFKTYRNVAIE